MEAVQNQLSALNRGHMVKPTSGDNDWSAGCPCSLQHLLHMLRSCTKYCQVMASRGEEPVGKQLQVQVEAQLSYASIGQIKIQSHRLLRDIMLNYKAPLLAWTSQPTNDRSKSTFSSPT